MQPNQEYPPQQYAPQGYGQPAPQQGYAPQAQYPPAQQAPAPAPGYGGPNPNPDEFGTPDAVGGIRPRLKDAGPGRLLLIEPINIERKIANRLGKPDANGQLPTQDRMTANVVFLDGPPFMYGGDPDGDGGPPRPHTMQATIPMEARNMWITNVLLISQCERSVGGGKVLGRLVKGESSRPGNRPPWKLDDPTDADRQVARDYLRALQEGRIAPPQQVAQQAPPQPQPQPQYAPQGGYVATGHGGAGGYVGPQYVYGGGGAPGGQTGAATVAGQAQQYLGDPNAGAQYAPQAAPMSPPPVDTSAVPAGWAPEVWANVPEEQRQMIAAASAARPGI